MSSTGNKSEYKQNLFVIISYIIKIRIRKEIYMYIDKRVLYIVLGIIILTNVVGLLSDPNELLGLLLTLPAVLVAITFHEYAHAFAADRLGDDTPRRQERLSLNPLKHLDPIGTIMLVFAGFGWGKPVEIEPRNFNRNVKMSVAEAIVSAAGPIMNFIIAIISSVIYFMIWKFASTFPLTQTGDIVMRLIQSCIIINIGLGVFNLIPLPPLDGSKIIGGFLPYNVRNWFENYYQIFYMVFIIIWVTGIASSIISPVISFVYEGVIHLTSMMFGINII